MVAGGRGLLSSGHVVDVAKVLLLEDGLIHAALAGLGESLAGNKIVESLILVRANNVASAGLVLDTLMADGAFRGSLTEGEVAIDRGETEEELASRLARKERFGLLLVNVSMEPVLAQGIANLVEVGMSVVIRGGNGAEPVEEASKVVNVDRLRGLDQVACLVLADKQSTEAFQVDYSGVLVVEGVGDGDAEELKHLDGKLIPSRLGQALGIEELLRPEQSSVRILDSHVNQDDIQLFQDFGERGTIVGVRGPAALNKVLQARLHMFGHRRALSLLAHGITEGLVVAVMSKGLLTGKQLPKNDSKAVNVALLVEGRELHHLRRHPERLDRGVGCSSGEHEETDGEEEIGVSNGVGKG